MLGHPEGLADPLGPAWFGMAMQEAIEQVTRKSREEFGETSKDLANKQVEGLEDYADNLKQSLQTILQKPVDERGWAQARLAVKEGGLDLRDPSKHAAAACAASVGGDAGK